MGLFDKDKKGQVVNSPRTALPDEPETATCETCGHVFDVLTGCKVKMDRGPSYSQHWVRHAPAYYCKEHKVAYDEFRYAYGYFKNGVECDRNGVPLEYTPERGKYIVDLDKASEEPITVWRGSARYEIVCIQADSFSNYGMNVEHRYLNTAQVMDTILKARKNGAPEEYSFRHMGATLRITIDKPEELKRLVCTCTTLQNLPHDVSCPLYMNPKGDALC